MRGARRAASASPSERSRATTGEPVRDAAPAVDCLRTAAAFERVLRSRPVKTSAHFAVHHLTALVDTRPGALARAVVQDLSTDLVPTSVQIVDDFRNSPRSARLALGLVVPKRHARRAVTRSLLKRQMRAIFARHVARLPDGAWVLRLRAPFDRIQYSSAASVRLREVVRSELESVVAACAQEAAA